jgi:hypothetical protein
MQDDRLAGRSERRAHPGPPADQLQSGMPRGRWRLKRRSDSKGTSKPDLGAATPKVLELFARALEDRTELRRRIKVYSAKEVPTVRDQLGLAWCRNQLRFLEPDLPVGAALTPASLWLYWIEHEEEQQKFHSEQNKIMGYLIGPEEGSARESWAKQQMLEFVSVDSITYLAFFPAVEDLFKKKPGRPVTRGPVAVRALQLKWDKNPKWQKIADEICDCGQRKHCETCWQSIRQAAMALQRLLKRHGLGVR